MASKFKKKFSDNISPEELDRTFGKNKGEKKESKVFAPGEHEVKIVSVEDQGPAKYDELWLNYQVIFEGVNGRTTRAWLSIPTDSRISAGLDGNYPLSTFKKFVRFCEALGIEGTYQTPEATLANYFENPKRLEGLHLKLKIGFKGLHAESVKNEDGKYEYRLVDRENNPVSETLFPNREAVDAYVAQNQLSKQYKPFPEILMYLQSATKNNIATNSSIKKISPRVEIPGFE